MQAHVDAPSLLWEVNACVPLQAAPVYLANPNVLCAVQLKLTGKNLKPLAIEITAFSKDVETVVVTAYAQALSAAHNYGKESGCLAFVNAGGCIWTEGHPDEKTYCAGCTAIGVTEGAVDSISAIADASAPRPCQCSHCVFTALFTLNATLCMITTLIETMHACTGLRQMWTFRIST
jgi:hypothetical protein